MGRPGAAERARLARAIGVSNYSGDRLARMLGRSPVEALSIPESPIAA